MIDLHMHTTCSDGQFSPEETMRNMGLIASPGMIGTEKTMMDILNGKNK